MHCYYCFLGCAPPYSSLDGIYLLKSCSTPLDENNTTSQPHPPAPHGMCMLNAPTTTKKKLISTRPQPTANTITATTNIKMYTLHLTPRFFGHIYKRSADAEHDAAMH